MIARGHLDVKVAVPCDAGGKPIPADGIFHEKAGIIEDRGGDKIAWNGSLNETAAGWRPQLGEHQRLYELGSDPRRVAGEEANFARIWANKSDHVIVLDVPDAVRQGPPCGSCRRATCPPASRSPRKSDKALFGETGARGD